MPQLLLKVWQSRKNVPSSQALKEARRQDGAPREEVAVVLEQVDERKRARDRGHTRFDRGGVEDSFIGPFTKHVTDAFCEHGQVQGQGPALILAHAACSRCSRHRSQGPQPTHVTEPKHAATLFALPSILLDSTLTILLCVSAVLLLAGLRRRRRSSGLGLGLGFLTGLGRLGLDKLHDIWPEYRLALLWLEHQRLWLPHPLHFDLQRGVLPIPR